MKNNKNDEQNIMNILSCIINIGWNIGNILMWCCLVSFGVNSGMAERGVKCSVIYHGGVWRGVK
jgi:hypothetical protein